ncbi:MAG: glycosyltransferase family 4 protein [Candidatus Bathyarchaeia archaeon]
MNNNKSILHIVQTPLDFPGGPATYVREISRHLAKKGIKVGIVAPAPSKRMKSTPYIRDEEGITFYFVETRFLNSLIRTPLIYSIKAHRTIMQAVEDYDVINIHVESTLLQGFTSLFKDKTLLLTIHGIHPFEDIETLKHYPINPHRLIHLIAVSPQHAISLKKISPKCRYLIPVSKFLADLLIKYYKAPKEKLVVIPNSVDIETFKPQPFTKALKVLNKLLVIKGINKIITNEKIILFIGRLEPRKGLHILIKSFSKLNDKSCSLIIVGAGDSHYVKKCIELAEKYGISNQVFYLGKVSYSSLKFLYSVAYVYVLPSMFEGLPTTVLEAMACGSPVIATKVSGLPEIIKHNLTGLLINKPDHIELANILKLILEDENIRKKLSVNGLNYVRKYFSWQANIERYLKLIYD